MSPDYKKPRESNCRTLTNHSKKDDSEKGFWGEKTELKGLKLRDNERLNRLKSINDDSDYVLKALSKDAEIDNNTQKKKRKAFKICIHQEIRV